MRFVFNRSYVKVQEFIQDKVEIEKRMADAQMFEELRREQERAQKHHLMNELKSNLDQHIQVATSSYLLTFMSSGLLLVTKTRRAGKI